MSTKHYGKMAYDRLNDNQIYKKMKAPVTASRVPTEK